MNGLGYIVAAWMVVFGVVALYALRLVQRERELLRRVPPERARWMASDDSDG